jgi:hypothetical protein
MKPITVEHSRCNVPGEKSPPPPLPPSLSMAELPSPHGLIEATSNFGLAPIPGCAGDGAAASMRRQTANLTIIPTEQASQEPLSKRRKPWDLRVEPVLTRGQMWRRLPLHFPESVALSDFIPQRVFPASRNRALESPGRACKHSLAVATGLGPPWTLPVRFRARFRWWRAT